MTVAVAYVGDAVNAAGYRLAGALALVPVAGEEAATFARARDEARVVLLSGDCAARLPRSALEAALAALAPLVLIVPDAEGRPAPVDPAGRAEAQLGLQS